MSILVKTFGVGILFLLNVQDIKEIGTLAVSKWITAIPKALVEIILRSSDATEIIELSQIVSDFLPRLVCDEVKAHECVTEIANWYEASKNPTLAKIQLPVN